jgi:hypothetical protein
MAPPTDSSRMGSNQSEENSSQVVRKGSSFLSHRLQPPGLNKSISILLEKLTVTSNGKVFMKSCFEERLSDFGIVKGGQ